MWDTKDNKVTNLGRFTLVEEKVSKDKLSYFNFSYIIIKSGVCVLPIIENDFILIRQYSHSLNEWIWELPPGVIDDDETPLQAAIRETEEEIGYKVNEVYDYGSCIPHLELRMRKYIFLV